VLLETFYYIEVTDGLPGLLDLMALLLPTAAASDALLTSQLARDERRRQTDRRLASPGRR
jgi:hypothetical protein